MRRICMKPTLILSILITQARIRDKAAVSAVSETMRRDAKRFGSFLSTGDMSFQRDLMADVIVGNSRSCLAAVSPRKKTGQ